MGRVSDEMKKALEIRRGIKAIARERDDALERSSLISLSNHRLFGALSRIGSILLEAKRTGSFSLDEVIEVIDNANRQFGRSSSREFVALLHDSVCPDCGSTGHDPSPDCDFCRSRSSFPVLEQILKP